MEEEDIQTNTDINQLDPRSIFDEEVFEGIKYHAYIFIDNKDYDGAVAFANQLQKLLFGIRPSDSKEKSLYNILEYWVLRLKLFGFDNLDVKTQTDLLKNNIVKMLKNGLDVRSVLFDSIDRYQSSGIITDITKGYLNTLLNSSQGLGESEEFKKKGFSATVSNWLRQYQESINKRGGETQPGRFDIINFMNISKLTQAINIEDKEVLKNLLDLYNWLLSPIVYVEDQKMAQGLSAVTKRKYQLPESLQPGAVTKPAPPLRQPPRPPVEVPPLPNDQSTQRSFSQNIEPAKSPVVFPTRPVNIQDILNKRGGDNSPGLNMSSGIRPSSIEAQVEKQRNAKAVVNIDVKLEELKKKAGEKKQDL